METPVIAVVGEARRSLRATVRAAGFVLSTAVVLGVGFGLCGVVLSVLGAVMGRLPAIRAPNQVVSLIHSMTMTGPQSTLSYPDYLDLAERPPFRESIAYAPVRVVATIADRRSVVICEVVSDNYFAMLGIRPVIGRVWLPRDAEMTVPVVISDDEWEGSFGRRSDVIGQSISLGPAAGVIVGVAPVGFRGLSAPGILPARFWIPVAAARIVWPQDPRFTRRDMQAVSVKIRLPEGTSIEAANAVAKGLGAALEREYPSRAQPRSFDLRPFTAVWINERTDRAALPMAAGVLALCGLMLLLTTAHAAHLVLARGYARAGDVATRYALGASRGLLVMGLTLETALVVALAVAIAFGLSRMAPYLLEVARLPHVRGVVFEITPVVDMRVVGGLVVAAVLVLFLCGFVPALRLTRQALHGDMRVATRVMDVSGIRASAPIVLLFPLVAGSMFVLALGAVFFRTLWVSWQSSTGLEARQAALIQIKIPDEDPNAFDRATRALMEAPGVEAAGGTDYFQYGMETEDSTLTLGTGQRVDVGLACIQGDFLDAVHVTLVRGRTFSAGVARGVAYISESGARTLWPNEDPIGQRFHMTRPIRTPEDAKESRDKSRMTEIVGVVSDTDVGQAGKRGTPMLYVPAGDMPGRTVYLVARLRTELVAPAIPGLVAAVERVLPLNSVSDARPLDDHLEDGLFGARACSLLLGTVGTVGLALAAFGVYSVASFSIRMRRRELAIRRALGATHADVVAAVFKGSATVIGLGLLTGAVFFLVVRSGLDRVFRGFDTHDGSTVILASALVAISVIAAAAVATTRDLFVEPADVLRQE
jgi:predicted permease